MDPRARILAKRYARAYMALDGKAHSAALEKASREKLEGLRKIFESARPHARALTHPAVGAAVKLDVLARIMGASHAGPAAPFASLLVRQNRFGLLEEIMRECLVIHDAFCGVVRAEVFSRYPLSEGEVKRINALLAAASGRKVSLREVTAERVLGGFELKIGDTLVDATARGRLEALKAGLMK